MTPILHRITQSPGKKHLALLIDPDRVSLPGLFTLCQLAEREGMDFILVGGSILWNDINTTVAQIKKACSLPVILFPGNAFQVCPDADAILFLSLISGRNPEYLIGQQVVAAPIIKQTKLEVIPTGYILIESGRTTAVEYMSNTKPIPAIKPELVVATAMAGEMLGMKLLYLEGGSGAANSVNATIISEVKKNTNIPVMVGGGIRTPEQMSGAFAAGADVVVLGTIIEENPGMLAEFAKAKNKLT